MAVETLVRKISLFILTLAMAGFVSARGGVPSKAPAKGKPAVPPKTTRAEKPTSLQVEPSKFALQGKWSSQTLLVMGRLADGTVRDVTSQAEFKSGNSKIAEVSKEGIVKPVSDGETTLSVSVKGGSAKVQVTVKDVQNDSVYFLSHVMPLINRLGCNQSECHASARGKGNFKLSMFSAEPESDYEALTKAAEGRRINKFEPRQSVFLLKATASIQHGGGQRVRVGSPEYNMLALWVASGAPYRDEKQPALVSVKVFPTEQTLQKGETQQLLATAIFADGTQRDVTRYAVYTSSEAKVAAVGGSGKVKADDYGESAVVVTYMRQSDTARVVVPQPLPNPFPKVEATNKVDELVTAKLKKLGIPPSEVCSDQEFLRRVFLDTIGVLPTPEEARAFLSDKDPQKRSKLIDQLLERDEFADYLALKWGDLLRIKSEYPVRVWPRAVATYYRWVRDSIAQNKPYDQFVRELLTSSGSNFRSGPANFFRAVPSKDPQTIAETAALLFMGARVGCARCHAHPTESWTLDDDVGLAAFFSKVSFKGTQEWKEEIVFINPKAVFRHPQTKEVVKPKFLGGETLPVGAGVPASPQDEDARVKFAEWLTYPQNPWFARNAVNRVWFWLLGRGIVHEPDDLRVTNPPQNPELLDYLAQELISHNYDLKHVFRLILNSRTYQLSSKTTQWNEKDIAHFSHYPIKRLAAEQLLDAICQVTETSETFPSRIPEPFSRLPAGFKATQMFDANYESPFLDLFGRSSRDTCYERERSSETSMRQALYFINSDHLENKVVNSPRIRRLVQSGKNDSEIVEEIYLLALSRFPKDEEKQKVLEYIAQRKDTRQQAIQDVVWAVLNTKEFMFNH